MKKNLYLALVVSTLTISLVACGKEVVEETPVVEETVETPVAEEVEEETSVVEEVKETEETEEAPKVVAVSATVDYNAEDYEGTYAKTDAEVTYEDGFKVKADDYIAQDGEFESLADIDQKNIIKTCKFLYRMDSTLPNPETASTKTLCTVYMRYSEEQLLELLNKDFSKVYDIIEKCGVDFTTDEGKKLVAAEMRTTITDFDSFHDAYMEVIEYSSELAALQNEYNHIIKDVAEKSEKSEYYDVDILEPALDNCVTYKEYVDYLVEFTDFYQMAYEQ